MGFSRKKYIVKYIKTFKIYFLKNFFVMKLKISRKKKRGRLKLEIRKNIYTADYITISTRLIFQINLRNFFSGIDIYSLSEFACNSAWNTFVYSKCYKE